MGKFDNLNALIAPEQPKEKPWIKGQVVSVETGSSSDEPTTTNNVGNLRPVGSDTGFQQFKTPQEGIAAMDKNLEVYGSKHGINTLRGVISRWAPTSENDTENYINEVSKRTSIKPDDKIDLSNPAVRHILSGAMMIQEKGVKHFTQQESQPAQQQPTQQPQEPSRFNSLNEFLGNDKSTDDYTQNKTKDLENLINGTTAETQKVKQDYWNKPLSDKEKYQLQNVKDESVGSQMLKSAAGNLDVVAGVVPVIANLGTYTTERLFGKSPEEAEITANKSTEALSNPLGRTMGITKDYSYETAGGKKFADFVGENLHKGSAWIAQKTGAPIQDIEHIIQAGLFAVPAIGEKGYKTVKTAIDEQFAKRKAPPVVPGSAGAAALASEQLRIENAKELLIPIELSKDQATRTLADVKFARETAKDPVFGTELQEHYAKQNKQLADNLEAEIEQTGSQNAGVEPAQLGEMLNDVVDKYKQERYAQIDEAYEAARIAGEMKEPVTYQSIIDYINDKRPTVKDQNPILKTVAEELAHNDPARTGKISLAAMEDIRQLIYNETEFGTPNSIHGRAMQKLIDSETTGKGGEAYKAARKVNEDFINEFEEKAVIRQITEMKKGTKDRKVALEKLVEQSLIKGSKADVETLFNTLQKAGPAGLEMIADLKAAVGERIRDNSQKGVTLDVHGRRYISAHELNKEITTLDKSGKLELIFGKKGAERYRTLNDVASNILTEPKGASNPSGTASTILAAMTEAGLSNVITGIPAPIITGLKYVRNRNQAKTKMNKIKEFVDYGKPKP